MPSFLDQFKRQPKIYVRLPSEGQFYDDSVLENNKIEIARSGAVVGLSDYLLASRNFPPAVMAAAAGERATNIVALALAWIALGLIFGHNPTVASDQRRSMLLIGETAMDMTRT